ncbi:decaprenyl-phosphate phosphoribosyltransferase [Paenibacillus sp. 1011MAR3C5]|uniref:decaprenyl-phosphate phosphoribosyltransferase n=1 Tax=Paenibacillus sp. 1011MAR3C5 TaxID=1675787 RepID=UPI000E6C8132|nr:decaprenyl-phosphate phosphoribosyltransferase [Paenibacillus sp. 1011MAR3C5]RJE90388.1 decaprenyl-phosphate phosphoribosyltransferase [Paenibacillus sp. 1011MAR3C5]
MNLVKSDLSAKAAPAKPLHTFQLLVLQLRPKQWTKNLLIFAALLFSFEKISAWTLWHTWLGFLLFSFVSGCVYIINDYTDREADRNHPEKRFRPMASGQLNPKAALAFGAALFVGSLWVSYYLNPLFTGLLLFYFVLNVSYSLKLKHIVIVDIMVIAAGFVLRAIAGGLVIHVTITPWFLICTMLLSLFLAIGKRRHELCLLQNGKGTHRKVLDQYSLPLLDQLSSIVTTATIVSYSLFTFTSGRTIHLMWTIPFVIYGIFRYLYLIHIENKGGSPDSVLLQDKHILATVVLYVISVVCILIVFE